MYNEEKLIRMQLTDYRNAKGITQKELSNKAGISVSCISNIENINDNEPVSPRLDSIIKYAYGLGLEIYISPINKTDK